MTRKKYLSSLSRPFSENKLNTKFMLLCLEFNKSNKQNVCCINLLKNSTFLSLKIIFDTDWCQEVKFDSGVILLDQSQFLATHSNQWDCFILYRQQITSNGFSRVRQPAFEQGWKTVKQKKLQLFVSLLYKTNTTFWRHLWSITEQMHSKMESIYIYTITQVILTFWLVLAYDLLENRHMIEVIITKFFPLHFKMAECFWN